MLEWVGVAARWIPARRPRAEGGLAAGASLGGHRAADVSHFAVGSEYRIIVSWPSTFNGSSLNIVNY